MKSNITIGSALKAALAAGVLASALNLVYYFIYTSAVGIGPSPINPVTTAVSSVIPLLLAGILFYVLAKKVKNGKTIFVVVAVVLGLLSLFSSFQTQLPDGTTAPEGFAALSAPMHLIAAAAAAFGIPWFTNKFFN
jgi:hypothetical protein